MKINNISFIKNLGEIKNMAVGVYDDGSVNPTFGNLEHPLLGKLESIISASKFKGELGKSLICNILNEDIKHIICIGLGEKNKKYSNYELEKLGANIYDAISNFEECAINICNDTICSDDVSQIQETIAFGSLLRSWSFDKYKSKKIEKISEINFLTKDPELAERNFEEYKKLADAVFLTKEVVSEPANVIYPETLAEIVKKELLPIGVKIEIIDKKQMQDMGMNALLAVAQGSDQDPKLVLARWDGADKADEAPIAFVGKGVTFDSGGISLKPGDGMHEMRHDMAGSGVVLGLMKAIASNGIKKNVVGVMALVENMPSGKAQRPGDIVTSMSGQTIEVLNTDAEGRMILADAIWYAQKTFSPKHIIDLATLTGAVVVALGHEFAAVCSNDDELSDKINKSASFTGEKTWRLPMTEHFDNGINSEIADMQNIAKANIRGGTITAAHFLKRFTNNVSWAHIDIAGVSDAPHDIFISQKGVTGFGVHLLYDFLKKYN